MYECFACSGRFAKGELTVKVVMGVETGQCPLCGEIVFGDKEGYFRSINANLNKGVDKDEGKRHKGIERKVSGDI